MNSTDFEEFIKIIKRDSDDYVDLLLLSKSIEDCFTAQDLISEFLNYDIYCIKWSEFMENPKCTIDNFNKIHSLNFLCLEPLIDILNKIISTLEIIDEIGVNIETNIFVPYNSELHTEYTKNIGLIKENFGKNKLYDLRKFDFDHIQTMINTITKLNVSIKSINCISIFYSNSTLISNLMNNLIFCTCFEHDKILNPILEVEIEDIYNQVVLERKSSNIEKYIIPTLFSTENIKKNMDLLNIDNFPIKLRMSYSRQVTQLMTFIQQITGKELWNEEVSINLLSAGSTSKNIARFFNHSYNNIMRLKKNTNKKEICLQQEVTLLIMDRNLDLISPIYSPILNMNINEDNLSSNRDIIEFLDEYINDNQKLIINNSINETDFENIHEITNPTLLSIMLDPDKLQKDLMISENYPVLSYRFISILEELQYLIKSGEKEFSDSKKHCIISRINSVMRNYEIYSSNSWIFLLSTIKQSQYIKSFWNELSDIQYIELENNKNCEKIYLKRLLILKVILKYLKMINNEIFLNENVVSPSTLTSTSSLFPKIDVNLENDEIKVIESIISILLNIRSKLLPNSITDLSIQFETLDSVILSSYDLSLEFSILLSIMHLFFIPLLPLELHSFDYIFVKKLKKKFTSSSFENLSIEDLLESNSFLNKFIALAISCSSYEGPDCKLSSFNLKLPDNFSNSNIKNKLSNIRNTRNCFNYKSFRNFQLCSFLTEKKYLNEFFSLISQICLYIFQTLYIDKNCQSYDLPEKKWLKTDLNMLKLQHSEKKCEIKEKILIINIVGNICLNEILELERLVHKFENLFGKESTFKLIILTDHICSSVNLVKEIINH